MIDYLPDTHLLFREYSFLERIPAVSSGVLMLRYYLADAE